MGYLEDIDAAYQNASGAAQSWEGVNAQAQNDAHKVMQALVAQRDAYLSSMNNAPSPPASGSTSPPPPPQPTPPNPWTTASIYQAPSGIKQAQPDIVIDPEIDTTGDYIVERFFEELGGTELINISRHDLIDGINVVYNPIANLSKLRERFNPNNIIQSDYLSQNEARNATIDIISRGTYQPYFDYLGQLVIEIDIMRPEENIEVEVSGSGTLTRIEL